MFSKICSKTGNPNIFLFSNSPSLPTRQLFSRLAYHVFQKLTSHLLTEEIKSLFQMLEYIKISDTISGFQKLFATYPDEAGM